LIPCGKHWKEGGTNKTHAPKLGAQEKKFLRKEEKPKQTEEGHLFRESIGGRRGKKRCEKKPAPREGKRPWDSKNTKRIAASDRGREGVKNRALARGQSRSEGGPIVKLVGEFLKTGEGNPLKKKTGVGDLSPRRKETVKKEENSPHSKKKSVR